mgnify:CR=1 FL=1
MYFISSIKGEAEYCKGHGQKSIKEQKRSRDR